EVSGQLGVRVVQQFYDGMGRLIQTKAESSDGSANLVNQVADTVYDGLSQATKASQPRYVTETSGSFETRTPLASDTIERWTTTAYDALGRVSTTTAPDGATSAHFYLVWSDNGLPRLAHNVVDANRHRTKSSTDALGRLVKVEEISGNCGQWTYSCATPPYTTQWAAYATTSYAYDGLDQLQQVTDANGNVTTMQSASLGRKSNLLNTSLPALRDPNLGDWNYDYDVNGNLIGQTDARGKRICFYYDTLNRLTDKHYQDNTTACPGAAPGATGDISYSYDLGLNAKGHRTTMTAIGGPTTSYIYDGRGRTTQSTYSGLTGWTGTRSFLWAYDSADRIQTLTYPSTTSVPTETLSYTYDSAWRPTSACSSLGCYMSNTSLATYMPQDQPQQWIFG